MEAKLGNYVTTKKHNHYGRVYAIHHSFAETNENLKWFMANEYEEETKLETWYSILVKDGGAVLIPEKWIVKVSKIGDPINNIWENYYLDI